MSEPGEIQVAHDPGPQRPLTPSEVPPDLRKGPLAWMAQNSVAANVLMVLLIVGGLMAIPRIRQEVFPEFELDLVVINVPYPGASPEEIEQAVILPVEEAVRAVDGIKEVRSTAAEGLGVVTVELLLSANADRVLADVKSAVDRIASFPADVEEPVVSRPQFRGEVISVIVYGDEGETELRTIAERVRDDLLQDDGVTTVELSGIRPLELSIEISQDTLRTHGLTHADVAAAVRGASVELPGGSVRTPSGEILIRTTERRDRVEEFEDIVVRMRPDGSRLTVGDLGAVIDGYREVDTAASFEGHRAIMVKVFRVGDQTPLDIAATVHEYLAEHEASLPPNVHFATWNDRSEFYRGRIDLLLKNAYIGLILVLVCLGLFLEIRLAFWVTLGIPISFIGSLIFLPLVPGASINMISLFAFILTLGMVVDDAIVVGEAIYKKQRDGLPPMRAAIEGVREVFAPVFFAILTTCIFFIPLLLVPGTFGKFFMQIPIVVILVLLLSLGESLLVLPAHLGHLEGTRKWLWGVAIAIGVAIPVTYRLTGEWMFALLFVEGLTVAVLFSTYSTTIQHFQQRFSRLVEWLIEKTYRPILTWALKRRFITLAASFALLAAGIGIVAGGRVEWEFFPKIDSDIVTARVTMPFGTPAADTARVQQRILEVSREVIEEIDPRGEDVVRGRFALLGAIGAGGNGPGGGQRAVGGHIAEVAVFMHPSDERSFTARQFAEAWRERLGEVAGVESLQFQYSTGGPGGSDIDFQLSHPDLDTLERAAAEMAEGLTGYAGVREIDDGFSEGKQQLDFTLRPEARARGVTERMLAAQLRNAFFGAEALREQRGRDEIRIFVRRPASERESMADIERLLIRTPDGGEIPLDEAADIHRGRSYTQIRRLDGRRRVNVTAGVEFGTNADRVQREATEQLVPRLLAAYPGLRIQPGGDAKRQAETMGALAVGFGMAMLAMFALLAVAFKSYTQPFIIATAIPFGFVGAVMGHLLMGYNMSLMSMMGFVALAGVVVNDSLVLVSAVNDFKRDEDMTSLEAVTAGGTRRFRPILLTSLTTFLGLTPMIVETSVGARFLIPMALSLGFGVLFATFITLLLVPALYLIVEDIQRWALRIARFVREGVHGHRGTDRGAEVSVAEE